MDFAREWRQRPEERFFPDAVRKAENSWLLPLATNKKNHFKTHLFSIRHFWMKGVFFKETGKLQFSLTKKTIPRAVDRNRIRRWGREEWKKVPFKTGGLFIFLKKEKNFYRYLKRKEFNHVFTEMMKKLKEKMDPFNK